MKSMVCLAVVASGLQLVAAPAGAVDGVILIDQTRALAGGVSPGDTAGFPVTLSQSGSYRLTSNLTVPDANTTAIEITADFVTLDLNGFTISGPVTCALSSTVGVTCSPSGGTGSGVKGGNVATNGVVTGPTGLSVRNGNVRGMGREGVFIYSGVVEGVQVYHNGRNGIIAFNTAIVQRSIAVLNGNNGIVSNNGVVTANTVLQNGRSGIAGNGIIATFNTSTSNWGYGLELLGDSGYLNNVLSVNNFDPGSGTYGPQIANGQALGKNACDPGPAGPAAPCP